VPGYRGSRSLAYEEFDPLWKRIVELDVLVGMHASDSGYARYQADWTGPQEMLPFKLDPFRMLASKKRPITDTMTAMVCHGALSRHPDLKVAAIENGGEWVAPLLHDLEHVYKLMPQFFPEHPVEAFKRNVYVSPFHEDDISGLIELIGVDHLLFGSDFPHPEGLAEPCSYLDHLPTDLSDDDVARIMGGNLAGLMGVKADAALPA
jgi:predicted TIM-barrel fold metal-dependent hydrolase